MTRQHDDQDGSSTDAVSFTLIAVIVGLLCFAASGWFHIQGQQRLKWPEARALIYETEINTGRSGSEKTWTPRIYYTYLVKGQQHQAQYFGAGYRQERRAEEWLKDHAKGARITVHYNPDQPKESYFNPGQNFASVALAVFGVLVILLGRLMQFLTGLQKNQDRKPEP